MHLSCPIALALGAALLATAAPTYAQGSADGAVEKPWLVRLRALSLNTANKSDAFSALETNFPANAVRVSNKTFPEVDFSYFFTPNFAAELVLTYPQRHKVSLAGVGNLGTIDHLPPTLMAQYHFALPQSTVKPYVGVGFNYTRITGARLEVSDVPLDVKRSSSGLALQVGADIKIGENLFFNIDYKRVKLATDVLVKASGAKLTEARLDPNLFSVGIGRRF